MQSAVQLAQTQSAPSQPGELQRMLGQLQIVLGRASNHHSRLGDLADRLLGPLSEAQPKETGIGGSVCMLAQLADVVEQLGRTLAKTEAHIDRLATL